MRLRAYTAYPVVIALVLGALHSIARAPEPVWGEAKPLPARTVPNRTAISTLTGSESVASITDQVSDSTIAAWMTGLVEFRTRYSCTDSNRAASQWIYDRFVELGYTEVYFDSFAIDHPNLPCDIDRNVVAVKEGSVNPDNVIVIGGHLDSTQFPSSPCDPDTLAPGADDDASGVAATLELARVFADVDNEVTLIFVAFGAEEQGVFGSIHLAESLYNAGTDVRVMVNLDVIAYSEDETWDLDLLADSTAVPIADIFAEMAVTYTDLIPHVAVLEGFSGDSESFYDRGYSTVWPIEADMNPFMHRCGDTMENANVPYCTDVTRMTSIALLHIMEMPDAPEGFEAINLGDGTSLSLDWDANGETDLDHYTIFWGTEPGVYDSARTVTAVGDTLRNLAEGETYYLAITATDTVGNESFPADEIEVVTNATPLTPTGIESRSLSEGIVLDWVPNGSELDLAGYNVYRRTMYGTSDTLLLAFVPEPTSTYTDQAAEAHTLYGYHVTAVDTEDPPAESDPSAEVYGRLATHDLGVLVIDNTADGSGGPLMPTDAEVDAFYADILRKYDARNTWDVADSLAESRRIMDYDLGIYSAVLWHSDVRGARSEPTDTTALRKYLDTGGNLWLSGWKFLSFFTGNAGPGHLIGEDDFLHRYVGIDSARTTAAAERDFVGAEGLVSGFPAVGVDPGKITPFTALFEIDLLLPPFSGADSIYAYVSSDSAGSEYHGLPVGVMSTSSEYGLVFTDFPLYFMLRDDAEGVVDAVMAHFDEPMGIGGGDVVTRLPRAYSLSQNYPNPFNPMTTIAFEIPGDAGDRVDVTLRIYDVRGRLVRTLVDGEKEPGSYQVTWNGRDDRKNDVSSGVYFYQVTAGAFESTRKMTLIR